MFYRQSGTCSAIICQPRGSAFRYHEVDRASMLKTKTARPAKAGAPNLVEPETPKEAINGTQRHLLLSVIPFFSRKLGIGKPLNLHEVLQAEASNLAIRFESAVDYWFCYNAVLKRNRLITHVIEELGPANIDKISIRLDDQRLYRSLSLGQGGGTAEVSATY